MHFRSLSRALSVLLLLQAVPALAQDPPGWNRRVTGMTLVDQGGGSFDVAARWRIDLEGGSSVPVELGTTVDLQINGTSTATTDCDDCLIWDIDSGLDCATAPDGTVCGSANISGKSVQLTCDADAGTCATPELAGTLTGVTLVPEDEIVVLLQPGPATMPDTSTNPDDSGTLVFGSWNRKLLSVSVLPTPGAPAGIFDVIAEVLIERTADATVPMELGISTEPVSDDCCQEACCCPSCATACGGEGCGGGGTVDINIGVGELHKGELCPEPTCSGGCGSGDVSGVPFGMTCDAADCVCRSETLTLSWLALPFEPGDELFVFLKPAPGALPELPGFGDDMGTVLVPGVVPAVSDWGVAVILLMMLTTGTHLFRRSARA